MITINFEPQELDYVFKVLTQRPWAEVNTLLVKLQQQVSVSPPAKANGEDKQETVQ